MATSPIFNFDASIISPGRLKQESPNFECRQNISNDSLRMTQNTPNGRVQGHVTSLGFGK